MSDQNIVIEDLKTGRPVRTVDASSLSGTTGQTFSRDLTRLLVTSKVSSPVLWNLEQGGSVALAAAGSLGSFSADGMRLVTGGDQQPFDIWEATGDVAFVAHPRAVRGLAVNFDGTRAVSVGEDGDVSLWAWDGHAATQMRVVKPAPQQARRRIAILAAIVCLLGLAVATMQAQQNPPRLIVDNRTPYVLGVHKWNGKEWLYVTQLPPGNSYAVTGVQNGELFRALLGPNNIRDHLVQLSWDAGYNGLQDVWWVQ